MRTVFCPVERFLAISSADYHWIVALLRKMYKNNAFFAQFLSIFCPFLSFFAQSVPQGVIIVPKMPERSAINFNSTRTSESGKTGS